MNDEKKLSNETLGKFIKAARLSLNITTTEMAEKASISESIYSKYEDGTLSIYIDHLVVFANILNIDLKTCFDVYISPEKYNS
ncbi:XRE family transcriptional regulator [Providencia heimbachae]|uniref:helix-turn-helix domain-containing protein n=1 Tax=Providencia heimbachae TaxID=333962 RepID=UPI0010BEA136|nr:helix-turn-helix transcriptional regulator [Providencia heimbachae]QCJ70329.1 XRE family transcriptional regulator [Providencia heimbachae]